MSTESVTHMKKSLINNHLEKAKSNFFPCFEVSALWLTPVTKHPDLWEEGSLQTEILNVVIHSWDITPLAPFGAVPQNP